MELHGLQLGQDIDGEAANDGTGYGSDVSLSSNGSRVAIGASYENGGNGTGIVYRSCSRIL